MERLQQELLARKKQIDDLQAAYTKLTRDHEAQVAKHRELSGRLGDAQGENAELQSRLQGQDMKHMSQVQVCLLNILCPIESYILTLSVPETRERDQSLSHVRR